MISDLDYENMNDMQRYFKDALTSIEIPQKLKNEALESEIEIK